MDTRISDLVGENVHLANVFRFFSLFLSFSLARNKLFAVMLYYVTTRLERPILPATCFAFNRRKLLIIDVKRRRNLKNLVCKYCNYSGTRCSFFFFERTRPVVSIPIFNENCTQVSMYTIVVHKCANTFIRLCFLICQIFNKKKKMV